MKKTLTLGAVRKTTQPSVEKQTDIPKKPKPSDRDIKAYQCLGKVMITLWRLGFKIKWRSPLSKKIYSEIREVISTELLSSKDLNTAIRHHVKSPSYLLMLRAGAIRYNINGKRDSRVSEKESKHALGELYEHHAGFMRDRRKRKNKPIVSQRKPHVKKSTPTRQS